MITFIIYLCKKSLLMLTFLFPLYCNHFNLIRLSLTTKYLAVLEKMINQVIGKEYILPSISELQWPSQGGLLGIRGLTLASVVWGQSNSLVIAHTVCRCYALH